MKHQEQKIPKIIHYCWFGQNPLPKLAQKCIKSWKKYCPDYQIMRWDETNFDINSNSYTKQAYQAKRYAFVSDYARLSALYNYGGIYLDTDMELIKNLDEFLIHPAFIGFQSTYRLDPDLLDIGMAIIGAQKKNKFIGGLLNTYSSLPFFTNGGQDLTTNTLRTLRYLRKSYNLQLINSFQDLGAVAVYPSEYFYPSNYYFRKFTPNTCAIHYYATSWYSKSKMFKMILSFIGIRLLGFENYNRIKEKLGLRGYSIMKSKIKGMLK